MTARPGSNNKHDCEVLRASLALRGPPFRLWQILVLPLEYEFVPADRRDANDLELELRLKKQRFWRSEDPHELEELAGELVKLHEALRRRSVGVWIGARLMEGESL